MSPVDNGPETEQALQDYFDDLFGDAASPGEPVNPVKVSNQTEALARRAPVEVAAPVLPAYAEPPKRVLVRPLPPAAPPVVKAPPPPVVTPPQVSVVPEAEVKVKPVVTPVSVEPKREAVLSQRLTSEVITQRSPTNTSTPTSTKLASEPAKVSAEVAQVVVPPAKHAWAENGRPQWAQTRFECLMFKVGGLTLAVPLVDLGTIQRLNDSITPIFGQADWFMGLLPVNQVNMRVVNTAKIVMPERYSADILAGYRYVITLFDSHWGLAADSVAESITLQPDQVRWRTQRAKRGWLAGTVVDHMCALLDVGALKDLLSSADRPRVH